MTAKYNIDLNRLLKLRLVVARFGEMDHAQWWNTNGILGRKGSLLMSRGFPKTYRFAQARLVFEVARTRSAERFPAVPNCITLWNLPAQLEEKFEARWSDWLESPEWPNFFTNLQEPEANLLNMLKDRSLLTTKQQEEVERMRRSAEGRAVPLSGFRKIDDNTITLLAAGYAKGEENKPAIPYARLEE